MEPIVVLPAQQVKELIDRYELVTARLVEADRELEALRSDKLVTIQWVAYFWSVDVNTARQMILTLATGRKGKETVRVLSYGAKIVRYRKSDIMQITESNMIAVRDMLRIKKEYREAAKQRNA